MFDIFFIMSKIVKKYESYINSYGKIYDEYIEKQKKHKYLIPIKAYFDDIQQNFVNDGYKYCDENEEAKFINSIFLNLNKDEKDFLTLLYCYFKQQLLYYFGVQDVVINYNGKDYNNELLDNLNNLEILLLFFPHIKDIDGLKTIARFGDIFLKRKDNEFQFTNMFYSFNDPSTTDIRLDHINYKEVFVDNIIICLNTLEKTLCRLYVNWVNVFPSKIKYNNQEHVMFDFLQTKIFKNTIKEYLNNKDNANTYENSVFNIKYDEIKRCLLELRFNDLRDANNHFKCFFNFVFPISILYNSLSYCSDENFQSLCDDQDIANFKNIIRDKPVLSKSYYEWQPLTLDDKNFFYQYAFKNNAKFFIFPFHVLSISGTLNICFYNKELNSKMNRTYGKKVKLEDRLTNNTWFSLNEDLTYFLTNMTYKTTNEYLMDLIKVDYIIQKNKFNFYHNKEIKKKNDLFEKEKTVHINISEELEKIKNKEVDIKNQKYYFSRWLNAIDENSTSQSLLYSAQILPQIKLFNNFINCRVSFVTGGTGTGKSTQMPILLLYALRAFDYKWYGNMVDTQPRKNAVEANARAISNFLGIFLPTFGFNNYVQYQTGDNNIACDDSYNTKSLMLKLVTDKILLNELNQTILLTNYKKFQYRNPSTGQIEDRTEPRNKYDIIIIDEVHEHNKNMDLLITLLRNIAYINNSLRLVLVSATIENDEPRYRQFFRCIEDVFKYPFNLSHMFNKISLTHLDRRVNISNPYATTYEIKEYFINDQYCNTIGLYDQYVSMNFKQLKSKDYQKVEEINNENTLKILNYEANRNRNNHKHFLVFKSGQKEIIDCIEYLLNNGVDSDYFFIPWLSSMNQKTKELTQTLEKNNIVDKIKIQRNKVLNLDYDVDYFSGTSTYKHIVFVATNIVEASITIDGLYCVIDDGFQKMGRYDYNLSSVVLEKSIISNQSRLQRRGRVGRTDSGIVYYLYRKNDIIDSNVKYKICYENFIQDYFDLLEYETADVNEFFQITYDICPLKIKENDFYKYNNEYKKFQHFNYYSLLYAYYRQISLYINDVRYNFHINPRNLCHDKNNNNLPFFTDNLIYSSKGYPRQIINDENGKFYLIHPNEKDLKRDINGNITKIINKDYMIYFEDYFVLRLVTSINNGYLKTTYSYYFNNVYNILIGLFDYIDFNGLLLNITSLIILTFTNDELKNKTIELLYIIYIFYFSSPYLSFDFFEKSVNVYGFNKIDDFEYIKEVIEKDYYKNFEEVEEFKKLYDKQRFYDLLGNHKELNDTSAYVYGYMVQVYELIELDITELTFNQLLVLSFYKNIVSPYKNDTQGYISKKIKDPKTIENVTEQNKFLFINPLNPMNKEIKIDYQKSIIKYSENPDYNNKNENYYIFFDFKNTELTEYIGLLYKINKEDLEILYYPLYYLNKFKSTNKLIKSFITRFDYLIENVCDSKENEKYLEIYNFIYHNHDK